MSLLGLNIEIKPFLNRSVLSKPLTTKASSKQAAEPFAKNGVISLQAVAGRFLNRERLSNQWFSARARLYRLAVAAIPALKLTENFRLEVRWSDEGWVILEKGSSLPLRVFSKKDDAVREAKRLAKDYKADMNVFKKEGVLQEHHSFA